MKKTLITVVALSLIGGAAFAQTVSSANIVGYSKQGLSAGQFLILAPQFPTDSAGITLGNAFPGAEEGTKVFAWTGLGYNEYAYYAGYGWFDGAFTPSENVLIKSGDSVWYQAAGATDVIMSGDVPMDVSVTITLIAGFNLVANPYPVALQLDDIPLSALTDGDTVNAWSGAIYNEYTYFVGYGWFDGAFTPSGGVEIPVGYGFWLNSAAGGTLTLDKQY